MTPPSDLGGFTPVELRTLQLQSIIPVDLFVRVRGQAVLYRSRARPFDDAALSTLIGNGVDWLWVAAADFDALHDYYAAHIEALIHDTDRSDVERAGVVVGVLTSMAREIVRSPRPDRARRTFRVAHSLASFVIAAPAAVPQLIQLLGDGSTLETHSANTAILAAAMAGQASGATIDAVGAAAAAGLLHDLGLRAVPAAILRKPGYLSDREWTYVRQHPSAGERLLLELGGVPADVVAAVRWHHERLDGSGYPDGLHGDAIPWVARAVAIAEVFDSLTTDQAYRPRMSPYRALRVMLDEMSAGLDVGLIRRFVPQLLHESWIASFQRGLAASPGGVM